MGWRQPQELAEGGVEAGGGAEEEGEVSSDGEEHVTG
jgi:hypothetical protein